MAVLQLCGSLTIVRLSRQAYKELRFEGVQLGQMHLPGGKPGCVEADMRSCSECGALPYFSYVQCSCRCPTPISYISGCFDECTHALCITYAFFLACITSARVYLALSWTISWEYVSDRFHIRVRR